MSEIRPISVDAANPHLTPEQLAWASQNEALWQQAHAIADKYPNLDVSDIYHSLKNLRLPPAKRLQRGLDRVRIRPNRS